MSDPSFKACHLSVTRPYPFAVRSVVDAHTLSCSALSFQDRVVVQLALNGELDTTYALQLPSGAHLQVSDLLASASLINSTCLIGSADNLQLQVMVNEMAKLFVASGVSKEVVLSVSSKLWGPELEANAFDKLVFILEVVKECLAQ